jgi:formylglycine-generating enzyme required for sulfatase activity
MKLSGSRSYDLFLAHAGADRATAETLFDQLVPEVHAWLDVRCLLPGDEWPKEVALAQRAALATVVLLSRNAEHAYYLTDETQAAIALYRRFPDKHRVVAVFLEGLPADPGQVPAGLHSLHSLDALAEGGLEGVARKLKALVAVLRERGATAAQLPVPVHVGLPERRPENPARPSPSYPDESTRSLSVQIDEARERKRAIDQIGADTTEIDREIMQLRRQLREGGQLRAGDSLGDGRYLLLQRLGKGGFAVVWEAYDNHRRERVAVKVLHSELASDMIRRERFFRGARIMAELDDQAIVRVLEPHAEEGGYHYFVMELLAGGDLRKAVLGGRLAGQAVLPAILAVGEALAKAHAKGLAHRDIKPANLLSDTSGMLRLTDFDLVGGGDTTGGTRTGAIGTWIYAAPELMHRPQDADARADVYGLGMTIAFCLHGAELTMNVVRDAGKFIDMLPCSEPVKGVLKRAVEWESEQRFANAGDFCEAFRHALAQPAERERQALSSTESPDAPVATAVHAREVDMPGEQVTEQAAQGTTWREPVTGMSFVWVPPGRFLMGSSKDQGAAGFDPEAYDDETPAREVELPHGVWMGEHPVTNAQYGAFLADREHEQPRFWQSREFNAAEQPVVGVSFEDALAFCAWLTERVPLQQGYGFDLPTEAEWEHAARGSDRRRYPWGNEDPTPERACFGFHREASVPIGGRPAGKSPFGCQDMAGNVWEWCLDAWQEGYGHMMTKSVNPCHHGDRGAPRVVRGGSWFNYAGVLRCAFRDGSRPGDRSGILGFRVVCRGSRQPWLVGS